MTTYAYVATVSGKAALPRACSSCGHSWTGFVTVEASSSTDSHPSGPTTEEIKQAREDLLNEIQGGGSPGPVPAIQTEVIDRSNSRKCRRLMVASGKNECAEAIVFFNEQRVDDLTPSQQKQLCRGLVEFTVVMGPQSVKGRVVAAQSFKRRIIVRGKWNRKDDA